MADARLTDFDSTKPSVNGAAWNHGVLDATTKSTPLLALLHVQGLVNFGDWRVNGIPLYTSSATSTAAGTAQHLSGHPGLDDWQKSIFDPFQQRFRALDPLMQSVDIAKNFAPEVRGITEMMRSGAAPLTNAAGQFIDGHGNIQQ